MNSNKRLTVLSRILYVLLPIGFSMVAFVSMQGCVSNTDGHDPAAVAMDGASNVLTDKPVTTAAQDWYYFFTDLFHGDH